MTTADLELSRLPRLAWLIEKPWRWLRAAAPRRRIDVRDLSGHLRRDIGIND
ncbi:MAG TPA: hypothetical protein VGD86_10100 [Devosia sp.]